MSRIKTRCQFCLLEQDFFKLIFFGSFRSVPSFGINSSVDLGMPVQVHSAEFFGNEIPLPTLLNNELSTLPSPIIFLPHPSSLISLSSYLFPLLSPFLLYFYPCPFISIPLFLYLYPCHLIHSSYLSPLSNLLSLPFIHPLIPHSSSLCSYPFLVISHSSPYPAAKTASSQLQETSTAQTLSKNNVCLVYS
jgi:hypothetical protein